MSKSAARYTRTGRRVDGTERQARKQLEKLESMTRRIERRTKYALIGR